MQRRSSWLALLSGLSLAAAACAQAQAPQDDEVSQLLKEYRLRETQFRTNRPASGEPDLSHQPATEYEPKFKALAEKYAGQAEALPALTWLCAKGWSHPEDVTWALAALARDHAARPEIAETLHDLEYVAPMAGEAPVTRLYDAVLAQNKDPEALARAAYQKGALLISEWPPPKKPTPSQRDQAAELFRKVVQDYPRTSVAKHAAGALFDIEKLQVGMPAPDLVGKDVNGKEIHLADYRGRVVVLAFWGHW